MNKWLVNRGRMPGAAKGKRIVVELRNGSICGEKPVNKDSRPGWAADGKGGCRWSLENDAYDIVRYHIL